MNYPIVTKKEDLQVSDQSYIAGIGTSNSHHLYFVEQGQLTFIKKVVVIDKSLPLFPSREEALEKATPGQVIRVGYPKSFIAYRVSFTKNEKGEEVNVLNFLYIV